MVWLRSLLSIGLTCVTMTGASWADTTPTISGKAEASAMEFARTHHPELASLLETLKTNAPSEYRSAILDLDKARERLEKSREKTPERAAIELAEWKVNSRIRLLVARMSMGGDTTLEADLKAALHERADLRVQLLADERDRLRRRLEKLDETIAEQQRRAPDQIEKELAGLKRSTMPTTASPKKPSKPTEAKPSDKNSGEKKASDSKRPTDKPTGQKSPSDVKPGKTDSKPAKESASSDKTKPKP